VEEVITRGDIESAASGTGRSEEYSSRHPICVPGFELHDKGANRGSDKVASRFEWTDRIKQEFFRVPGTGRQFLLWAFVIDLLEEGRVETRTSSWTPLD
jgi:hypothetical protein